MFCVVIIFIHKKIQGPWSGPWSFFRKNPRTMVRTTSIYSQKSKDRGPDLGLFFAKIQGPWSGPRPLFRKNPRTVVRTTSIYRRKFWGSLAVGDGTRTAGPLNFWDEDRTKMAAPCNFGTRTGKMTVPRSPDCN